MCIKTVKTLIISPSPEHISRVASYIPLHTRCLKNFRYQIFPEESKEKTDTIPTSFLTNATD